MKRAAHHETAHQALEAYTRAETPPSILVHRLCGAVAQMLANDLGGTVLLVLPGPVKIIREINPTEGRKPKHGRTRIRLETNRDGPPNPEEISGGAALHRAG